jgi:hypothetical protein
MGRSKTADDSELHHEWTVPIGELKSINPGSSAQQNSPYILEAAVRFTFSVFVSQLTNVALPSTMAAPEKIPSHPVLRDPDRVIHVPLCTARRRLL